MLANPWICPSCCLKEYDQLIKLLMNTFETLKAEVASLKKQVNSNLAHLRKTPSPLSMQLYDVRSCYYHFTIALWYHSDLWHWFTAYLTDRKQYVSINNCHSSLLPVISGVP